MAARFASKPQPQPQPQRCRGSPRPARRVPRQPPTGTSITAQCETDGCLGSCSRTGRPCATWAGCTECFSSGGDAVPLRCEECGCGYRADGAGTCGTPGCGAGQRRVRTIMAQWERQREAEAAPIRCELSKAVICHDPAGRPRKGGTNVTPWLCAVRSRKGVSQSATLAGDEGGVGMTLLVAACRAVADTQERPIPTGAPLRLRIAPCRAPCRVEALLAEGLSDREIARAGGVSPSTVWPSGRAGNRQDWRVRPKVISDPQQAFWHRPS